jgi:hypothetical protein
MNTQPFKLVPIKCNYVHSHQVHVNAKHIEIIYDNKITIGKFDFQVTGNGISKPPRTGTLMFIWKEGEEILALPKASLDLIIRNNLIKQTSFDATLEAKLFQAIKIIDRNISLPLK